VPLCEVNHLSFVTEVTASVQKMCYAWERMIEIDLTR
jgi:hypothetical protein